MNRLHPLATVLATLVAAVAMGCPSNPSTCVTGMVIECPCGGSATGTQRCQADGTYSECRCEATDAGPGATDSGPIGEDSGPIGSDAGPAEPDAGGHVYFAGRIDGATAAWASLPGAAGRTGLEAGHAACQAIGADHVCDYEEVVLAAAANQLADIPVGTTAWVQRTTTVEVMGRPSEAGPGGNCVNWTYITNHNGDGEYMTFEVAGVPTFHLDNDTFWDGIDTTHIIPGDLECGGVTRSVLCCHPAP